MKSAADGNANNKGRATFYKLNRLIKNQFDCKEFTNEQVTLYLLCCGKISVYENPSNRIATLHKLWDLLETNKFIFDVEHYNVYIKVYTENKIHIDCESFLSKMKCKPNHETFKLLLRNVCEKGDLDQMFYVLSLIKDKGYSMDEETFNCLVLGHTAQK